MQEDAAEAFQKILEKMHTLLLAGQESSGTSGSEKKREDICNCLVHENFATYSFSGVEVSRRD